MSGIGRRAIIIGASSGMGAALAENLAARGCKVAVVARRESELARLANRVNRKVKRRAILTYPHDVANASEVPELFQRITSDLGGVDLVIYAAGAMPRITAEEFDFAKDRLMVEVNYLGAIAWLNEAARRFQNLKAGHIVAIGSIAGDRGRRGNPVYCSSKAALAFYMESLRNRLARYGVGVTTIKPGFVDTAMTKGLPGLFWLISPERAAQIILSAVRRNASSVYVPARWGLVAFVIRNIPTQIFRYLSV